MNSWDRAFLFCHRKRKPPSGSEQKAAQRRTKALFTIRFGISSPIVALKKTENCPTFA
jgi:hypothetical protein